uniref:Uncharacterized protein n=1 Tax=Falco tinnunculus TaxID=100819 RepID=A0A8C4VBG0_FALTI
HFLWKSIESTENYLESSSSKTDAEELTSTKLEKEEESSEELGRDVSGLERNGKGEIKPEEDEPCRMGDENLEAISDTMRKADKKKKVGFDVVGRGEYQKAAHTLHVNWASVFLQLKKWNAAIRDCNRAIKINPNSAEPCKWRRKAFQPLSHRQQSAEGLALPVCGTGGN